MFLSCKSYCFFIRNIILSQSFDVEGCAGSCSHNCHGVLYLDNHGQELSQLPVWWKSHTWWGFVVLFLKCKFFMATTPRTTFFGFATITTTFLPFPWRRSQPWSHPSRASWCRSPNTLFSSGGNQSLLQSTRSLTISFNQHGATRESAVQISRRSRWIVTNTSVVLAHFIRWWRIFKRLRQGSVACLLPSATSSLCRVRRMPWLKWAERGRGQMRRKPC